MSQYSKTKFNKTLGKLTDRVSPGCGFGLPMGVAYRPLANSVNRGNAIRLYRYRPISKRNLDDLLARRVHLSVPSELNDIEECWPRFDLPKIRRRMEQSITPEVVRATVEAQLPFVPPELRESYIEAMRNHIENFEEMKHAVIAATEEELRSRYANFRGEIHCACFSEDPCATNMWGLYADSNKGMVIQYDIAVADMACWCSHCDEGCHGNGNAFVLCPIQYDGVFDMSDLSHVLMDSCRVFPYPTLATVGVGLKSPHPSQGRIANPSQVSLANTPAIAIFLMLLVSPKPTCSP